MSTTTGCYTILVTDAEGNVAYRFPVQAEGDAVVIHGAGEVDILFTPQTVTVDAAGMCELWVFAASQEVPRTSESCASGSTDAVWVVQLASFSEIGKARSEQARLAAMGVVDTQVYDTDDWATVCPGWSVVWSRTFSTLSAANDFLHSLPDEVKRAGPFARIASNLESTRSPNCQTP